jgi:hypothetical protein
VALYFGAQVKPYFLFGLGNSCHGTLPALVVFPSLLLRPFSVEAQLFQAKAFDRMSMK